jgi:hypothetical protein
MQSVPQLLTSEQKLGVCMYQEQLDEVRNDQNYLWKVIRDEIWLTVTTQKPNGSLSVEKLNFLCCVMLNITSKLIVFDCAGSCNPKSNT